MNPTILEIRKDAKTGVDFVAFGYVHTQKVFPSLAYIITCHWPVFQLCISGSTQSDGLCRYTVAELFLQDIIYLSCAIYQLHTGL